MTQRQDGVIPPAALRTRGEEARTPAISPRLAPGLSLFAGGLIALGSLGMWVRATSVSTGALPEQVEAVTGASSSPGWILFGLGVACAAAAFAWTSRASHIRMVAPAVLVVTLLFASIRLALIDSLAARMAQEAVSIGGIDGYHAGFGWGAWLMLAGVVAIVLALLAGGLREIDLWRGA